MSGFVVGVSVGANGYLQRKKVKIHLAYLSWSSVESHWKCFGEEAWHHPVRKCIIVECRNHNVEGCGKVKEEAQRMAKELRMTRPMAWQRSDLGARTTKTTMKGGPSWDWVPARITADAKPGQVLTTENAAFITRNI